MKRLLCWLGFHQWGDEYLHLVVVMQRCERCGESRVIRSLLDSRRPDE